MPDGARVVYFTFQLRGSLTAESVVVRLRVSPLFNVNLHFLSICQKTSDIAKQHISMDFIVISWLFTVVHSAARRSRAVPGVVSSPKRHRPRPTAGNVSRGTYGGMEGKLLSTPTYPTPQLTILTTTFVGSFVCNPDLSDKVWSLTWGVRTNAVISREPMWLSIILLVFPWIIWIGLTAVFAVIQVNSRVYRSAFYCTSDNEILGAVSGILAAVLLILCLIFQAWTVILVYRRYRKSRRLSRAEVGDVSVPFLARIIAFALFILVALALSFVAVISTFALEVPDIIISSIGVVIFLIFASQEDVLVAWWIIRPKSSESARPEGGQNSSNGHMSSPESIGRHLSPSTLVLAPYKEDHHELQPSPTKHRFESDVESEATATGSCQA